MAAKDGNPGKENPGKVGQSRQPGSPDSTPADVPDHSPPVAPGHSGGNIKSSPTCRIKSNPELSDEDAEAQASGEQDDGEESGNFLNESELDQPSEPSLSPESEGFWQEETQLSSSESVREDMGTIALERIPIDEQSTRQVASKIPAGLGGDLYQASDAEIMQRAGAGDEAALEFLIAKYRRPIISFMYRMVHNQAVAEELAQEVFLRVYRARATYRAEARFSTWLYRIASNMAINHARDTKYERASGSIFLDQADEDTGTKPDVPDLRPIAEQDMLQDERMQRIREHVMALPERQRMAVVMHKYQDMDYKQIGAVLKLSESATKSLLFRAYQTLREKLKEFA
ncbi:MAG: RNA polymerase sigma factor [Acidobacteriota bacterium]